jgi:hypothetical protein
MRNCPEIVMTGTVRKPVARVIILAGYSDRHLVFRAAESPAFCPRQSAARKCRGQCRPGDRSRPWTGKADRSTSDFPSFRLRQDHYCRRWVDSRVGTRAEKVPAAQGVDPAALAQLGSKVLRQLRRQQQHSAFAFYFSTTKWAYRDGSDPSDDVGRGWPVSDADAGLMQSEGCKPQRPGVPLTGERRGGKSKTTQKSHSREPQLKT